MVTYFLIAIDTYNTTISLLGFYNDKNEIKQQHSNPNTLLILKKMAITIQYAI